MKIPRKRGMDLVSNQGRTTTIQHIKIRCCHPLAKVLYYPSVNRTPRMLSSAGEHRPYKAGVVGSKPTASTNSYMGKVSVSKMDVGE